MRAVLLVRLIVPVAMIVAAVPAWGQRAEQANPRGVGTAAFIPPEPATADSPVAPAMPADPGYHGGAYTGALTAPPPDAMGKAYPVCTPALRDGCTNPGAARRARGTPGQHP